MEAFALKLLLIEDSPLDVELALLHLERAGFAVEASVVGDHRGAERLLREQSFDLILSDFVLPGSSGSEALQVARILAPDVPFIFFSGVFGEEHAVEMMRLGAVDYVLKRNIEFLPKAVRRAMDEVHERRERQRAERALQEVEVRARLAIDAARMGMWDYRPDTGQLICDARCRQLFDFDEDEVAVPGVERIAQRLPMEDRERLKAQIASVLTHDQGEEFVAEFRVNLASGSERWISTRGRAFFSDGRCVRCTGVLLDITEQKLANQALQQLNEMLGERVEKRTRERDRTWDLSREMLAVMRFDSTPIAVNPAWEETLGWSRETLLAQPLWGLVHPDDREATHREGRSISRGNVSKRFVNRMRHADGDYHWLSWTVVPENGLMYAAVRDITGEREALDELATTNRQLREQIAERERMEQTLQQMQRLEAVGQLTAGVAHDFNNLLTVIITSAGFLQRELAGMSLPAKTLSRLQSIRESGERGAKLTGQLLSFSRRQRLAPEALDLNVTLAGMLELLRSTLGGSMRIETRTRDDLWRAMVDPTQIELIILNLAINARDAMGVGGTLCLSTANEVIDRPAQRPGDPEPGEYVVLSVSDNGSGMSDEVLAKAFEPFFTTKEIGKGSGLGLAQVFGFAKQSGGGAHILTDLGQGTTVKVYLPRVVQAPLSQAAGELPSMVYAGNSGPAPLILLVDDDAGVREVTAGMLEELGYRVREASSGQQALESLDESIDLLLADFAMPGMNGAELARRACQRFPQLPVLFITGYAELGGLQVGESHIVQKPFSDEELAHKVALALQGAAGPQGLCESAAR